jgi:hypothetical protein
MRATCPVHFTLLELALTVIPSEYLCLFVIYLSTLSVSLTVLFFPVARQPLGGLGRLIFRGFAITHFLDTSHSVGLLWTRDQPVAETST